jgi:hypothetical protein
MMNIPLVAKPIDKPSGFAAYLGRNPRNPRWCVAAPARWLLCDTIAAMAATAPTNGFYETPPVIRDFT